jgi:hypothetical protein
LVHQLQHARSLCSSLRVVLRVVPSPGLTRSLGPASPDDSEFEFSAVTMDVRVVVKPDLQAPGPQCAAPCAESQKHVIGQRRRYSNCNGLGFRESNSLGFWRVQKFWPARNSVPARFGTVSARVDSDGGSRRGHGGESHGRVTSESGDSDSEGRRLVHGGVGSGGGLDWNRLGLAGPEVEVGRGRGLDPSPGGGGGGGRAAGSKGT